MRLSTASIAFAAMVVMLFLVSSVQAGQHFFVNPDGTLSDPQRGLVWSQLDSNGDIDWHDANRWAKYTFPSTLSDSTSGWRLPSAKELDALMSTSQFYSGYETSCGHNVRILRAFELSCGYVWAAGERGIQAWYFSFQNGYTVLDRKVRTRGMRALAVRPMTEQEKEVLRKK